MKNINRLVLIIGVCVILLSSIGLAADSRVIKDTVGFFRNLQVAPNEEVRGSAVAVFGNIDMQGVVYGDVVAIFGSVSIDGIVEGNVVSIFGGVKISSDGKIQGDVVQILGGGLQEAPGAQINGARISMSSFGIPGFSGFSNLLFLIMMYTLIKLLISYVMAVIVVLIFPERFNNMADSVPIDMGRKFIIGIMIVIGFYVVAAMLIMVVIGIPFFLLLAPLMALLSFTGNTVIKLAMGKKLSQSLGRNWSQMLELFMGSLIYGLVDITIIGKSATFLARVIGIGAVIDSKAGHRPFHKKMGFISLDKEKIHIDENKE